jgi:cell division protein FtsW (lipid II flippase)
MRLRPEHPLDVIRELPWFAGAMVGLAAMLCLEHFFVHKLIVLPTLEITAQPPLWMWGAMFVPELVWFFAAGWRLRSWSAVGVYAVAGAMLREGFDYLLARAAEPGHIDAFLDPFSDFAVNGPAIAIAYAIVLGLAAWSGRHEGRLVAGP